METASNTESPLGPAILGVLLHATASLPREPSTDVLLTQAFLQADSRALRSPEFRAGLAACLASMRHPGDPEAQAQDAAQWEALLSDPWSEQLLFDARLTPEQRLANLSFFLLRPAFPLELLSTYEGNLTALAGHEAWLALQAFPVEQVAPVARFPATLAPRVPELDTLTPPVDAQAIATLGPDTLRPERAALILESLADELFGATLDDSPVKAHRQTFATVAAEGLRALAAQLRAETDPQKVAQALVLGALQHQAFFQSLTPFTEDALARREQPPGTVSAVEGAARELIAASMGALGMALGGPLGAAAAGRVSRGVAQDVDTLRAGGKLPLGALAGEVLGVPGLGTAPHALGEVVGALTQLYTAQLAGLSDEAAALLEGLLPLLLQGEVEGLGAAWATLLGTPERLAALQAADASLRAEVLRVLLVSGAVGAFPWDAVVPVLSAQGPALFGHSLPSDTPPEARVALYAASAARAVAVLGNDELLELLSEGELSPPEALAEAQGRGARLFVGGTDTADPALAAAMLGALVPPAPSESELLIVEP